VHLVETFSDQINVNFVFEYLPGQDLFWVLNNEHNLKLSKKKGVSGQENPRRSWVTFYAAELLTAVEFLHKRKIIYRDIKPDNLMIDVEGHVKLIDFGFAKQLSKSKDYRT